MTQTIVTSQNQILLLTILSKAGLTKLKKVYLNHHLNVVSVTLKNMVLRNTTQTLFYKLRNQVISTTLQLLLVQIQP